MIKTYLILFVFFIQLSQVQSQPSLQCSITLLRFQQQIQSGNITDKRLAQMLVHSAKSFNDFGDERFCTKTDHDLTMVTAGMLSQGKNLFMTICIPAECNANDLNALIHPSGPSKNFLSLAGYDVDQLSVPVYFQEIGGTIKWEWSQILTAIILGGIVLFNVAITLYFLIKSLFLKQEKIKKNSVDHYLQFFDLRKNVAKFLTINPDKYDKSSNLNVFSGIRFTMMYVVLYGHNFMIPAMMGNTVNPLDAMFLMKTKMTVFLSGADYSVDLFFFMGGFFSGFVLVKKVAKVKISKFPLMYLKILVVRYLRIMPAYMAAMFFYWKLQMYVMSGPLLTPTVSKMAFSTACDKTWWHNVLLMDDFLSHWGDQQNGASDYCFGWAWYLSCDFHMFLTAPIIIYILTKSKKMGWALISALFVIFTLVMTYVWYANGYSRDAIGSDYSNPNNQNFQQQFYGKPYTRYAPYLLGIMLGYCYQQGYFTPENSKKQEQVDQEQKRRGLIVRCFQYRCMRIIVVLAGIGIWLGVYAGLDYMQHHGKQTQLVNWFYVCVSRTLVCFATFLIIFPALYGQGKLIRFIFGSPVMVIMGRLSYCIYLVHLMLLIGRAVNLKYSEFLSTYYLTEESFVVFFESIFYAFLLSMLVEVPFMKLLKEITTPKKPKKKVEEIDEEAVSIKVRDLDSHLQSVTTTYSDQSSSLQKNLIQQQKTPLYQF